MMLRGYFKRPLDRVTGHKNGLFSGHIGNLIYIGQKMSPISGRMRHKAGGASPLGVARAAWFEELAGVFPNSGIIKP